MYEVLPTEPLHNVKENISNIISDISALLSDDAKKLCELCVWSKRPTMRFRLPRHLHCACETVEVNIVQLLELFRGPN